jgi:hypothetical protein
MMMTMTSTVLVQVPMSVIEEGTTTKWEMKVTDQNPHQMRMRMLDLVETTTTTMMTGLVGMPMALPVLSVLKHPVKHQLCLCWYQRHHCCLLRRHHHYHLHHQVHDDQPSSLSLSKTPSYAQQ